MYKGIIAGFAALIVSVSMLGAQAAAQNPVKISVVAGYPKTDGTFTIVIKDTPGTHLVMYVNDTSPTKATANKKDWATFRHVPLSGLGKLSFAKAVKGSDNKSYQKPINYTEQYTVANGTVSFAAPAVAAAPSTSAPAPVPAPAPKPTPAPAPAPAPSACSPLTNGGNCYEPGEYCRNSDHGASGIAGDGKSITCENNNGWRWEPN